MPPRRLVAHFPHAQVRVIDGNGAGDLLEGDAEPALRRPQRRRHHVVELQVRLDLRFVEVVLRLAHLLGEIEVVPRLYRDARLLAARERPHVGHFVANPRDDERPDLQQEALGDGRIDRHRVLHAPVRVALEPEKLRPLGSQPDDGGNDGLGVVGVAVVAAALEFLPDDLAKMPPSRERQKRIDARSGIHDGPRPGQAALFGGGLRGCHDRRGKPVEIGFAFEHDPRVLVGEHLGAKLRESRRKLLVDGRQTCLLVRVQLRASPHEVFVHARRQPHLIRVKIGGRQPLVDGFNPLEQGGFENDVVGGRGELWLPLMLERLILGVGDVLARHAEHPLDAIERTAHVFHGNQRVIEGRWLGIGGDLVDFPLLLGNRRGQSIGKKRGCHLVPWRHPAIRAGPGSGERIGTHANRRLYFSPATAPASLFVVGFRTVREPGQLRAE